MMPDMQAGTKAMLRGDFSNTTRQDHIDDHAALHQLYNAQSVVNVAGYPYLAGAGGDDTAAFAQAIRDCMVNPDDDPATTVRSWKRPLYIPAGTYLLSEPMLLQSIAHPVVFGDGYGLSRLVFTEPMEAGLHLDGLESGTFRDFSIDTTRDGALGKALWYQWRPEQAGRSMTNNRFYNIEVGGKFGVGIQIGGDGGNDQEDQSYWFACRVNGGWDGVDGIWWQDGWRIGSGVFANNLIHSIFGIAANNCRYGVHMAAGQALISGGNIQSNGTDFYLEGVTSYFSVQGIRSEKSGAFLRCHGAVGYVSSVSISDCEYYVPATGFTSDSQWIRFTYPGSLSLRNIQCNGAAGEVVPVIHLAPGSRGLTVDAFGVAVQGANINQAFSILGDTAVYVRGFSEIGDGGQVSHTHEAVLPI